MKVLHVTPSHARKDGGPSETLRGLVPELTVAGLEVHTLTTDKGAVEKDRDFEVANQVTVVRSRRPRSWNFAPGMFVPLWRLAGWADIVHIHSVNSFPTSAAMIISRLRRTPYVLEPHGAFDAYHMAEGAGKKRIYNTVFDRFGFRGVSGVLTSSRREREDARAVISAKEFDLPLGVDAALFSEGRVSGDEAQILFLGRIARKKRLDIVLRALAEPALSSLAIRLIVAGPIGDDIDYSPTSLAEELGIRDRVSFVGSVDSEKRRQLLASSDVFVLPSEDESFGVAVAEALAAGCAVVASAEVGIASEAAEAEALRLTALDPSDLASQVASLLSDRASSAAMGARGREFARGRYEWPNSARAAIDAYEAVLQA